MVEMAALERTPEELEESGAQADLVGSYVGSLRRAWEFGRAKWLHGRELMAGIL